MPLRQFLPGPGGASAGFFLCDFFGFSASLTASLVAVGSSATDTGAEAGSSFFSSLLRPTGPEWLADAVEGCSHSYVFLCCAGSEGPSALAFEDDGADLLVRAFFAGRFDLASGSREGSSSSEEE